MKPETFAEHNRILLKPDGMTREECGDLPIYTDGVQCVSRWRPSLADIARLVFGGSVWLIVRSGTTQHPVALATERPFMRADISWARRVGKIFTLNPQAR